jgi:tyrosinase
MWEHRIVAGSMVYRLEVRDTSATHMRPFVAALTAAQARRDNESYNWIAGFHGTPGWYCWHHQINSRTPVQSRLFLPWHRAYLWWLEQALQDRARELPADIRDVDIALPWWDWTRIREVPPAYEEEPLSSSHASDPTADPPVDHVTTRRPGLNPRGRLPRPEEIFGPEPSLLAETDWPSFSDRLEDFHDGVHVWMGGDMGTVATAAYDPIFFAHHCMIDRIWYLWQVTNGNGNMPRELYDLELIPFGKRVRDVLSVHALGYEYAQTSTEIPIDGGGNG